MATLRSIKAWHAQQVTCIKNYKKAPGNRLTISYVESKLKTLEECWEKIFGFHTILLAEEGDRNENEVLYLNSNRYDDYEEEYYDAKYFMEEKLLELKPAAQKREIVAAEAAVGGNIEAGDMVGGNGAEGREVRNEGMENFEQNNIPLDNNGDHLRLPRIPLPTFNGEYGSWTSFRDQFKSMIDTQPRLPLVHRLFYLKSSLQGEAAQLLKHFQVTEANYQPAWQYLLSRYENKRILINTELKKLFEQPIMMTETVDGIKTLLDTTNDALQELNNLGIKWETY